MKKWKLNEVRMVGCAAMRAKHLTRIAIAGAALLMQSTTIAHAQPTDTDLAAFASALPPEVLQQISRQPDVFLQQMANYLFQISPTGVATPEAAMLQSQQQVAQQRAQEIMQFLRLDLDGDTELTAAEIEAQLPYLDARQRGQIVLKMLEGDTNSDQTLSFAEIRAAAQAVVDQANPRRTDTIIQTLMAFDANADGQVDLVEISDVLRMVSRLTPEPEAAPSPIPRRNQGCSAPRPQAGSEIVFLSGYEGAAVSTLAVSGQDVATSVATVTIAQGGSPLYIFATAYDSIVWKFDGATERVQRLVVQPGAHNRGAAIAGIPAEHFTFVAPGSCIENPLYEQSRATAVAEANIIRNLRRPPTHIVISYKLADVQIPPVYVEPGSQPQTAQDDDHAYRTPIVFSLGDRVYELSARGMIISGNEPLREAPNRVAQRTIREMMRFYPGGLIAVSPDEVYSNMDVAPYEVLPQQAGLLQLFAEGNLEARGNASYLITAPIPRFPAGLSGAHSVGFVLRAGVPMPAGSPGHSRVTSEETGECLAGCR